MLDCKKSLDYQKFFIQVMEDVLLFHIRYSKKEIEREIKIVFLQLKKYLSECDSKDEFKKKSLSLSEKIKKLKDKLNRLQEEEKKMIVELKNRVNKTFKCLDQKESSNCSFLKFKEYNEYQNDVILGQYFLDKGYLETFFSFQKENNLKIYEYNFYAEKKLLINYINEEKTKKILEWVKFYKKKIIQNNSGTILELLSNLFYIYKNEQSNEIDCDVSCISFIRKYFSDFTNNNRNEITKLIMSLIIPEKKEKKVENKDNNTIESIDIKNNDNKQLISSIKNIINEKYKELFGLGIYPLFELLVTLGLTTLKTNVCENNEKDEKIEKKEKNKGKNENESNNEKEEKKEKEKEKEEKSDKEGKEKKEGKDEKDSKNDKKKESNDVHRNNDCPICGENGCNLSQKKNKIYNYVHNRSYLFCSITGKVTNASNPPMINKDGKVICKACINKYKVSEEKYVDPKTKKEYKISECKLLYLS